MLLPRYEARQRQFQRVVTDNNTLPGGDVLDAVEHTLALLARLVTPRKRRRFRGLSSLARIAVTSS